MSDVISIDTMTKSELIQHLECDHSQAVPRRIAKDDWTKTGLLEAHRIIHLGLGASADHSHGERR